MSQSEFVHLHLHTEFSLLDAACRLKPLMAEAKELGFPAIAITDHGNMYGAIDFYQAARKQGVKPIIGCEVYVAPGSRFEKKSSTGGKDVYNHLVLLAKDQQGYQNLVKLVSAGFLEGYYYKPRVDMDLLAEHSDGLIALSGCLASRIPTFIKTGELDKARDTIDWFKQTFGPENFYLELQNHGIEEQLVVNRQLIPWAKEFDVKLVATNDVHYIKRDHWHAHDALICLGTQSQLADENRMRYVEQQFYLRSADEMAELFKEVPDAVKNTLEVAEKCNVEIDFSGLHYPVYTAPEGFTQEGLLRKDLADALFTRYAMQVKAVGREFDVESIEDARVLPTYKAPDDEPDEPQTDVKAPAAQAAIKDIIDRLQTELGVIEKMGFVDYFLIVGDFVRYGRSKGITCVARGSAAGSIVAYLLEISNVDPLQYSLLFERFLNPERVNPPDIDIDFADDRRQDVIEYTREKYGEDSVAQIITFGTMGAKSVIRDVGRVMGLTFGEVDRLAKMIPNELKITLQKALDQSPDFKKAYEEEDVTRELIDTARVLEDCSRQTSVHAAAVVIGNQPLVNVLPLKKDEDGTIVTQYPMNPVGDLGLLKMDFLGLKTLTVIRRSCEMIKETKGIEINVDKLPLDDEKTYDLLNRGLTVGVFQLESGGMRDLCRKFKIGSVEHITALISLYRPGPMDLIPDFIERRHGRKEVEYVHPMLESISKETYGILIYQEQVMLAAQILGGFTLGGADLLRRAMGKKKIEEMHKQRELFVKGCKELNGIPADQANKVFDILEKFAGYGFNKSHAAAYAVVAYQTAYLKANHPVEFLSAMMTNDMGDTAKVKILIDEAKVFGIDVLPPDVNESKVMFGPARNGTVIRYGLAAIKGVGEGAVESMLKARAEGGRFTSIGDLCERVDGRSVNRKILEALIKSGACDSLCEDNRATMFSQIDDSLARAASLAQEKASGQVSLFGEMDDSFTPPAHKTQALPEWPDGEKLAAEKELLGFYVSGHPLQPWLPLIEKFTSHKIAQLGELEDRTVARIGGLVSSVQKGFSKRSGKPYAMVTIEDLDATVTILCMNETYDNYHELLEPNTPLMVVGEVNNAEDKPKIFPVEIMRLSDAPKKLTLQAHVRMRSEEVSPERIDELGELLKQHAGQCPLFLCFKQPGGELVFIEANERYFVAPSLDLQNAVDKLLGPESYYAKPDPALPEAKRPKWERRAA